MLTPTPPSCTCLLQAAVVLREHPGTTVVTDSVTSNGLTQFITSLGGKHFRWEQRFGDAWVPWRA